MYRTSCCIVAVFALLAAPLWAGVPKAMIDLGNPDVGSLMTHIQGGDGDTTAATVGNLACRRNVDPNEDYYFYFGIADAFAYQGSRPSIYISIHYYDIGTATLTLQYDATSEAYKNGGSVTLTNSNTWKNKTFRVTDGYFGNRQNGGADFRIAGPIGTTYYLDLVYARDFCGPNPRVRIHPPPGRPTMNAQATRDLMEHMDQWPVTRGLTQVFGDYDHSIPNFTDAELSTFYAQLVACGIGVCMETGAITQNGGEEAFYNNQALHQRIVDNGGPLNSLVMQEPLTVARYSGWGDEFAANETVDWIQLVRQNYSGIQIGSIEAYPYISSSSLQWWLTTLQDRCAQRGVEGIDYFVIDCDWKLFPGNGSWTAVKNLETWCHNVGLAFSVIYWPCPHADSMNDVDFYTDIMNQGSAYQNVGGAPDEYDIQCWDYIPVNTVPETTDYTFTNGALRFTNQYVPRPQTPYTGVIPLPGVVQAENFDNGGENVSYHDLSIGNTGGAYRIGQSVDIETTSDTGGGYNVGWIDAGEWLEYTVNVPSTRRYDIRVRAATPNNGCSFHIEMNGQNVTGTRSIPNTGSWQTWTTVTTPNLTLTAGQQVMRVVVDYGGWNLNYVEIVYDATPPGPVTNFTATPSDSKNTLSWTNPSDADFSGTMIRYKTTGFPTSPTDGTQVYNGSGTSCVHSGVTNGVTYYYSAYAHDDIPNYASAACASAAPTFCFRDLFDYPNGPLNGNGGWTGSATAAQIEVIGGYVRIWGGTGSKDAVKTVSCVDPGTGYIWVRCKINGETGASTMWSLWINDSAGKNLGRWYGTGTTARGRIGGTALVTPVQTLSGAWEEIAVKINPYNDTSEFFFNGNSVGTLSHSSQGAGNSVGQLRWERIDNTNPPTDHLYFDDLRLGGT